MIDLIIPETLHSSLFEEGAVSLNDDVQEWVDENIKGAWSISENSASMPVEPIEIGLTINIIMIQAMMRFESLEDATLFKLRWL